MKNQTPQPLLLMTAIPPAMRERLSQHFALHDHAQLSAADCAALAPQLRALLCNAQTVITRQQLQQWPRLELISVIGVGTDGIDLGAAAAQGVQVRNTPDVATEDIADHTMALLLATARQIVPAHQFVQQGRWLQGRYPPTRRVWGQRLGIVGLGRIGHAVAKRAQAFEMSIAYTGRSAKADVNYRWVDTVQELAAQVDFLVVCASGGPATEGLIDDSVLQALGPAGVLINIGRGSIVDEAALLNALQSGVIAAAALDVFAHEPYVPQSDLPNLVMTPHMASSTQQGLQAMLDQATTHLLEHFERVQEVC